MSVGFRHIQRLSVELQNQIAAGEVVERPASIVKELVENSLDARASQIDVFCERGGRDLIRVQDDGHGIPRDELTLAVTRHATSKITCLADLEHIQTMGFRGEALPSIVSVSRFRIASAFEQEAYELNVTFGKEGELRPSTLPRGTLIEVQDLFANTPARLKFLKSIATEGKRILEILFRIALAHLDVGFSLTMGERSIFSFLPREGLTARLSLLWPESAVASLRPFHCEQGGLRMHGLAGEPSETCLKANHIYLYVNGRAVQDKRLLAAVKEAYKGRITSRDYPQCILFVEIDPREVDVNVHPAKTEVRFQNEAELFAFCVRAVRSAFPEALSASSLESGLSPSSTENRAESRLTGSVAASKPLAHETGTRAPGFWGAIEQTERPFRQKKAQKLMDETMLPPWEYRSQKEEKAEWMADTPSVTACSPAEASRSSSEGALVYLGQIARTYLLFRDEKDSLLVLDQHAAHERVLFARFSAGAYAGLGQTLLMPKELPLHPSEQERLHEVRSQLGRLGFALEVAKDALLVRAIPPMLAHDAALDFLRDVLSGRLDAQAELLKSIACKGAIKAGHLMTNDEVEELLKQWLATPERDFCPHGRPAVLRWDERFFEKAFKRSL